MVENPNIAPQSPAPAVAKQFRPAAVWSSAIAGGAQSGIESIQEADEIHAA